MKKLIVLMLIVSTFSCGCTKSDFHNDKTSYQPITPLEQVNKKDSEQPAGNEKQVSEELYPIDIEERNCIENNCSTTGMNECSYKARTAWFKEIDKYMQLLKKISTHEDYQKILNAQNKWKQYQEAEFEAVSLIMQKDGTMFQNVSSGQKTGIVKERALELKEIYEILSL